MHTLTDEFGNPLTLEDFGRAIGMSDEAITAALANAEAEMAAETETAPPVPAKATTKIEALTDSLEDAARRAQYVRNLMRGLNNEPENYEYTGEVVDMGDTGKCACGHSIRWGFPLKHKSGDANKGKIVGSTCVGYFAEVNEELFKALCAGVDALNKRLAEAKAASKRAQAQADVDALAEQWATLYSKLNAKYQSYRERGEKAPRALWEAFGSYRYSLPAYAPEYTRPADFKRWYKAQIKRLEWLAAQ